MSLQVAPMGGSKYINLGTFAHNSSWSDFYSAVDPSSYDVYFLEFSDPGQPTAYQTDNLFCISSALIESMNSQTTSNYHYVGTCYASGSTMYLTIRNLNQKLIIFDGTFNTLTVYGVKF